MDYKLLILKNLSFDGLRQEECQRALPWDSAFSRYYFGKAEMMFFREKTLPKLYFTNCFAWETSWPSYHSQNL